MYYSARSPVSRGLLFSKHRFIRFHFSDWWREERKKNIGAAIASNQQCGIGRVREECRYISRGSSNPIPVPSYFGLLVLSLPGSLSVRPSVRPSSLTIDQSAPAARVPSIIPSIFRYMFVIAGDRQSCTDVPTCRGWASSDRSSLPKSLLGADPEVKWPTSQPI